MSITEAAASVAARAFFYPSLAYNIARSRLQDTWNWWDEITENVILGALPFHSTLDDLKQMRVSAVVTLNEEFEVFITPEQYKEAGFRHLHIPTVDFLYAPQTSDLHRGADFIHEVVAEGGRTYVHCKAGRGRSTTLVLCYLIKYLQQTPADAYAFVRERRPQVYLAHGQWTAVCSFYMSCHPEKELTIEDFPYPTFLPIAPGKQGSDGPEPDSMDGANEAAPDAPDASTAAAMTTAAVATAATAESNGSGKASSQSGQWEAQAGEAPAENGGDLPGAELTTSHADAASTGDRGGGPGGTAVGGGGAGGTAVASGPAACGDDAVGSSPNLVRISAHAAETDDVVLLHHLGSDHSGSEASLSSSMASCRLNPRAVKSSEAQDPDGDGGPCFASSQRGFRPPERVSSPAIEIKRGRSTEHKSLGNGTAPCRSTGTTSSGGLSKASIALEPSGSLPGYVRIAHVGQMPSSSDDSSGPVVQTTFASTGFTPIEDWADVDKRFAGR